MRRSVTLRAIIGAFIAVGFQGCLLGPDFLRPEQEVGEVYYQPTQAGESFANLPWWEVFGDPVLQGLIRDALAQNRDLRIATARIEESRAILGFTRADQFPRVDLAGGASRQRASDNILTSGPNPFNNFGLFGDLSFELDIWGKLRRATEAQQAALLSTEYAQRAVVYSLVSLVATTYFRILGLDERISISRSTIEGRRGSTNLIRARLSKGIVPELEVNQAEIEEASARADLADFERELGFAEHALAVLLGKPSGPIPRGRKLGELSLIEKIPAGFPAELLERRPDVLAAEAALHTEVARIGVTVANRLPTINLLGSIGLQSEQASDFFDANSFTWSIGGSLLGPLLDFGKSKSVQEAQEARAQAALHSYERTVLEAIREVNDAQVAIRTYNDGYKQRLLQTKAARNAARLSHARYDEGVTAYLEVFDVERSLFDAELLASQNRERYFTSIVQLYKALGGGWKESEPALAQASP